MTHAVCLRACAVACQHRCLTRTELSQFSVRSACGRHPLHVLIAQAGAHRRLPFFPCAKWRAHHAACGSPAPLSCWRALQCVNMSVARTWCHPPPQALPRAATARRWPNTHHGSSGRTRRSTGSASHPTATQQWLVRGRTRMHARNPDWCACMRQGGSSFAWPLHMTWGLIVCLTPAYDMGAHRLLDPCI